MLQMNHRNAILNDAMASHMSLVVGKVIRIARTLKASTSFPVLKLEKETTKLPGVTEFAVLEYKGVENRLRNLVSDSYTA